MTDPTPPLDLALTAQWTRETPTIPGWYWYIAGGMNWPTMARVEHLAMGPWVVEVHLARHLLADVPPNTQWLGPIETPMPPTGVVA